VGLILKALKGYEDQSGAILDRDIYNAIQRIGMTASGEVVTEETAMRLGAVYACISLLSKSLAMTPLVLYRKTADGREKATDDPLFDVLRNVANPYMTAFTLKERMMLGSLINGNSYAYIQRNRRGDVIGLQYIPHGNCWPEVNELRNTITYRVTINGKHEQFAFDEILHIPGLGYDGVIGFSPIQIAREVIGRGLATQTYGSSFFKNGARLGGVFEHPNHLSETAFNQLKKSLASDYSGASNSNKTMILEEGMKFSPITIPPEQAQFLDTMKFNVAEIARIYGVPPHMIGDLEKATFSNIEHQSLEYVQYSMLPWFSRWEQHINLKCLTKEKRNQGYYVEFMVDYLLRGDSKSRAEVYRTMRQNGALNADEWREKENMNKLPDGQGEHYLVNGNMISLDTAAKQEAKTTRVNAATE